MLGFRVYGFWRPGFRGWGGRAAKTIGEGSWTLNVRGRVLVFGGGWGRVGWVGYHLCPSGTVSPKLGSEGWMVKLSPTLIAQLSGNAAADCLRLPRWLWSSTQTNLAPVAANSLLFMAGKEIPQHSLKSYWAKRSWFHAGMVDEQGNLKPCLTWQSEANTGQPCCACLGLLSQMCRYILL